MARRVRPKTRPKPPDQEEKGGSIKRIKIRMGRATSDPFHQAILKVRSDAEKEGKKLAKAAGFKGYKSGVAKQKKLEKKKRDALNASLDRLEVRERLLKDRLTRVDTCLSLLCGENEDHILQLNAKGLRVGCFGPPQNESYKLLWDQGEATMRGTPLENGATTEFETNGDTTDITSSRRHKLHPGRKIPIADMWDIWNAAGRNKKDVDPMQGIRGAWYWNERRYSAKAPATSAWRRHMRNKIADNSSYQLSDNADEMRMVARDVDGVDRLTHTVVENEPSAFMVQDFTPYELAQGRSMRNRLNRFFRNHGEQSVRWWLRHYDLNREDIETAQNMHGTALTSFVRVCAHFEVPLEHWDDGNWQSFRQQYNHFLEVKTNRGAVAAGQPVRRRRRATRGSTNRGYNRSNY